jgi:ATPase subunit of ABC transporter with duplicated ATPase domains
MSRKQFISLCDLSFELPHKICFENFHATVHDGDRIVLIGDNGSGKSSLIKILLGETLPSRGSMLLSANTRVGYLPQDFDEEDSLTVWEVVTAPVRKELEGVAKLDTLDPEEKPQVYEALLQELIQKEAFSLESHLEELLEKMHLSDKKSSPYHTLSGGERMRLKVAKLLAADPELILLDEPTNHLDLPTRQWLMNFLTSWRGAAIIISHDYDLLELWPEKIWSIERGQVITFDGSYSDYIHHREIERQKREAYRQELMQRKKVLVRKAQSEETRRSRTAKQGKMKYNGDPLLRKGFAERAENTMGKAHIKRNSQEKEQVLEEIRELNEPQKVPPRFYYDKRRKYHFYLKVEEGKIAYSDAPILENVNFSLATGERVAITGANGTGKTTLLKALLGSDEVKVRGSWDIPASFRNNIGHLDQHHENLMGHSTILEHLKDKRPDWGEDTIKRHLNAFLFYDHRTWHQQINTLSEGEKMRLSLALIAADPPTILFLDEVSNHLDLSTKEHLIEVLKSYEGALVVNSHEQAFLKQLEIDKTYSVESWKYTDRDFKIM